MSANGLVHKPFMHVFTLRSSKMEIFESYFSYDILTTRQDHPRYVMHVLGCICVFFTSFGYWVQRRGGVSLKGFVQHLLPPLFSLDSPNIKDPGTHSFDFVVSQNHHPRYVCFRQHLWGFHLIWA